MPESATGRAHDAVLRHIEDSLRSGELKLGDRLPGERALAEQFGISRASVRDAIRSLEVMGVVRSATGSGPNSGTIVVSDPSSALGVALRMHVASHHLPVKDVVEARIMMETWSLEHAASAPWSREQLDDARRLLEAMDDDALPSQVFTLLDSQFHVALSALAGNVVVSTMMESMREAIRGYIDDAVERRGGWDEAVDTLREQHRGIFEAVEARDGERSARLVREHIEWFYAQAL
ncbi:DNA-binding FadR family transcriptional regulator [Sinomonas atrocyanea]|uniref:FadR/GntR family transcriptional regulator n=1 Tax=Sinomonas atrocyanea TaxID=37927 RepID=UPI002780CF37|nr:FCD domain-containing protein [Sinomonas atrocyanea]MDP9885055.1 DNA-binding FadR family transcriptional regulator [Sinomonas atrocyanea]